MGRGTHSRRDSLESRHYRTRYRRKSSRHQRNDHLPLRRRRPFRARSRKLAKDGLQKRPLHGRRLLSLENRWIAEHKINWFIWPSYSNWQGERDLFAASDLYTVG